MEEDADAGEEVAGEGGGHSPGPRERDSDVKTVTVTVGETAVELATMPPDHREQRWRNTTMVEARSIMALGGKDRGSNHPSHVLKAGGSYKDNHTKAGGRSYVTLTLATACLRHWQLPEEEAALLSAVAGSAVTAAAPAREDLVGLGRSGARLKERDDFREFARSLTANLNNDQTKLLQTLLDDKKRGAYRPVTQKRPKAAHKAVEAAWEAVVKLFCKGDVASRVLAARTAPDVMTPMQGASMSQSPAAGLDLHAQALERAQQSAPPEVIAGLLGMLQNHPQVCKGLLQEFPLEPELMPVLMDTLLENIAQRFEDAATTLKY